RRTLCTPDDRAGYGNGHCRPCPRRSFRWLRRHGRRDRRWREGRCRLLCAGAAQASGGLNGMARDTDKPEKDYLRPEDRILWETVAKTAKPLIKPKPKQDELPDFKSLMTEEEKRPAKAKVRPAVEASKPK